MVFIDEASIHVVAGRGGDGCVAFRREKYVPRGGPSGGDGGDGGSVIVAGDRSLNTLFHLRHTRRVAADRGRHGEGSNCAGKMGADVRIRVPPGTLVRDPASGELLAEILTGDEEVIVAHGGRGGRGNARFATATRQAPDWCEPGRDGQERDLELELKLLADVGLLGFPNAGKSTFIRAVSAARPRVADYPFTTLHPNLGVVRVERDHSFVIADIPGIIEDAAEGAGLGIQFLKHVMRTRLLLHLVDAAPMDESVDPVEQVRAIEKELKKFDATLLERPRWLVLNKIDLIPEDEREKHCKAIVKRLKWKAPWFMVSAATGEGTLPVVQQAMTHLDEIRREELEARNA